MIRMCQRVTAKIITTDEEALNVAITCTAVHAIFPRECTILAQSFEIFTNRSKVCGKSQQRHLLTIYSSSPGKH